ncbi:hypothetical protein [Azospirillum argentinense]
MAPSSRNSGEGAPMNRWPKRSRPATSAQDNRAGAAGACRRQSVPRSPDPATAARLPEAPPLRAIAA